MTTNTEFHDFVTRDGSSGFKAEAGRYHLYVSHACPWAHRTTIVRVLKGLEKAISLTVVHYVMSPDGWAFVKDGSVEGSEPDPVLNASHIKELYLLANPNYVGRFSVPVLFDKQTNKIVNNESSEIIRMLNSEFNEFGETEEQRKVKEIFFCCLCLSPTLITHVLVFHSSTCTLRI